MKQTSISERDNQQQETTPAGLRGHCKKYGAVVFLISGLALFFILGLDEYVSFEALREHRQWLMAQVNEHAVLSAVIYIATYAVVVAFSLPIALVISISGGFLFGAVWGTLFSVVAATTGATAIFMVARSSLGDVLKAKAGPWLDKLGKGFCENEFSYLMALRLIPVAPFFIVNLVPAFLGVKLRTYVVTTFIGIIPGGFVYALVGAGLGSVFEAGESFSPTNILTPEIIGALCGLGILSLLPVVFRYFKSKKSQCDQDMT